MELSTFRESNRYASNSYMPRIYKAIRGMTVRRRLAEGGRYFKKDTENSAVGVLMVFRYSRRTFPDREAQ